jgi:hypothetical protein
VKNRARWAIAHLLDRLPGQCWTELVWWATTPDRPIREAWSPIDGSCRSDARQCGRCYCNKLGATDPLARDTRGTHRRFRRVGSWPLWARLTLLAVLGVLTATVLASSVALLALAPLIAPLPALREVEYATIPDPEIGRHGCDQCVNGAVVHVVGDPHEAVLVEAGGLACGFCAAGVIGHAVDQLRDDGVVQVAFFAADVCTVCWRPGGGHWPGCPQGGA